MARTAGDVLDELAARGLAGENPGAALSCISQAAEAIGGYCNLPKGVPLPDGLFYAWTEAAGRLLAACAGAGEAAGAVTSISEGDTAIRFGGSSRSAGWALDGCREILNRYRRMGW